MNKEEQEQALKLSKIWKELADKGTCFEYRSKKHVWDRTVNSPKSLSDLSRWRVAEPEKKTIDLSKMIGTDVDMEFAGWDEYWEIGILYEILYPISDHNCPYIRLNLESFKRCRVRQNHVHWYKGFPLPDGLLVTLYSDSNSSPESYKSQDIDWDNLYDVSGYEVIDTLPEYCYEWQKDQTTNASGAPGKENQTRRTT